MRQKGGYGKVQREKVQVVGNSLSEEQAVSVATCSELDCGSNGKEARREEKLGGRIIDD